MGQTGEFSAPSCRVVGLNGEHPGEGAEASGWRPGGLGA